MPSRCRYLATSVPFKVSLLLDPADAICCVITAAGSRWWRIEKGTEVMGYLHGDGTVCLPALADSGTVQPCHPRARRGPSGPVLVLLHSVHDTRNVYPRLLLDSGPSHRRRTSPWRK